MKEKRKAEASEQSHDFSLENENKKKKGLMHAAQILFHQKNTKVGKRINGKRKINGDGKGRKELSYPTSLFLNNTENSQNCLNQRSTSK